MCIKLSPFPIYNEAIIAPCQGHSHCYLHTIQIPRHSMGQRPPDTTPSVCLSVWWWWSRRWEIKGSSSSTFDKKRDFLRISKLKQNPLKKEIPSKEARIWCFLHLILETPPLCLHQHHHQHSPTGWGPFHCPATCAEGAEESFIKSQGNIIFGWKVEGPL